MSMPLGVIAYSGGASEPARPKPPKQPKQPRESKTAKLAKKSKESNESIDSTESTDSSRSVRFPQIFKRRNSTRRASAETQCDLPTAPIESSSLLGNPLTRRNSLLSKIKHVPVIVQDHKSELSSIDETCTPVLAKSEKSSITSSKSPDLSRLLHPAFRASSLHSNRSRHVEIAIPQISKSFSNESPTIKQRTSTVETSDSNPLTSITSTIEMSASEASSRTSTLDSRTSAPSPNQLYSRKESSAQLSIESNQSSLGGRDDYASASEQDHPYPSSVHYGRSPANPGTPSQSSNLSGLVCNVHRTTGKEPPALVGATTTILGDKLYVFGGRRISRTRPNLTSDLYELDLLHRHWARIDTKGDIPPPRYFHSVCALGDNKLVCYGGMSPEPTTGEPGPSQNEEPQVTVMSDIHIYDVPTRTWKQITATNSPQGRYAHCAAILPSSAVFTSAQAPVSAMHHNPPDTDPNHGSIGIQIDGTGGAELIVIGGQDSNNRYIEQISVFNLRSLTWTSTLPMSGRSCGAYRSVVTPLTTMSAARVGAGLRRPEEEDYEDEDEADNAEPGISGSPMLVYTNYNFLDVKLELQVRLHDGTLVDKQMMGPVTPPGLRFPSGGIIGNNFVVSGTFLTSTKQEFALWALDLRTLVWARIDTGSTVFSQGSWNRGVLWNRRNAFVTLGNRKRNLVDDYNNRRLNFPDLCIVQLEAFGLYDNPRKSAPTSDYVSGSAPLISHLSHMESSVGGRQLSAAAELLGEKSLSASELSDMDFLAIDGTRLSVNSRLVARRWGPHFNMLFSEGAATLDSSGTETATLRPAASVLSRNSSITITPSLHSNATTLTANAHESPDPNDVREYPPNMRPRTLYLPHTVPTLQALIHFLYTSSLPPLTSQHLATPQIFCSLLQIARPYKIDGLLEAVIERLHESLDSKNAAAIFNAAAMGAGGGQAVAFAGEEQHTGEALSYPSASNTMSVHPPRTASLAGLEGLSISGVMGSSNNGTGPGNGLRINTDIANGAGRPQTSATVRRASQAGTFMSTTATVVEDDFLNIDNNTTPDASHSHRVGYDDEDGIPSSASTTHSTGNSPSHMVFPHVGSGSFTSASSAFGFGGFNGSRTPYVRREEREVWDGGWSAVIGLQKRGLRGLMEGRRARERGGGVVGTPSIGGSGGIAGPASGGTPTALGGGGGSESRIGLGIV